MFLQSKSRRRSRKDGYLSEGVNEVTNTLAVGFQSEVFSNYLEDYQEFSQNDTTVFDIDVSESGSLFSNITHFGQKNLSSQNNHHQGGIYSEDTFDNHLTKDISECGSLIINNIQSGPEYSYLWNQCSESLSECPEGPVSEYATLLSNATTSLDFENTFGENPDTEFGSVYSETTPPATECGNVQIDSEETSKPSNVKIMGLTGDEQVMEENVEIFPTLHISEAGLLSVLLRQGVVVEMTIDRTIRLIDHTHKTVVAVSCRGDMSCLNHTAARLYNQSNNTEADIFWDRHLKISTNGLSFASGKSCFFLHPQGIVPVTPNFMDLSSDTSVTLLFASSTYGPHIVPELERIVQDASYSFFDDGGFKVLINNVKVQQFANDDVLVAHDKKSLFVSPTHHTAHVDSNYSELAVERDWTVKLRRRNFQMLADVRGMIICDGERECGFNSQRRAFLRPAYKVTETIIMHGQPVYFTYQEPTFPIRYDKQFVSQTLPVEGLQEVLRKKNESEKDYFQRLENLKKSKQEFDEKNAEKIVVNNQNVEVA